MGRSERFRRRLLSLQSDRLGRRWRACELAKQHQKQQFCKRQSNANHRIRWRASSLVDRPRGGRLGGRSRPSSHSIVGATLEEASATLSQCCDCDAGYGPTRRLRSPNSAAGWEADGRGRVRRCSLPRGGRAQLAVDDALLCRFSSSFHHVVVVGGRPGVVHLRLSTN